MEKEKKVQVNIPMPAKLRAQLKLMAQELGVSQAALVRTLVKATWERQERRRPK